MADGSPAGAFEAALAAYRPTDSFFGAPFIDVAEERALPTPHLYLHGGFEGTATRFSVYFPPGGGARFFHVLEGGYGGNENGPVGSDGAGPLPFAASRGAFLVQSNQGHPGAQPCPKAGGDVTIYAYRASAECARLARRLAAAHYGAPPAFGYLYGGSGGGMRTLAALEHLDDFPWEGAVAYMHGTDVVRRYSALLNARRLLGRQFDGVVDAVEPGGSGNPFEGLATLQREALAHLYATGFPRGAERSAAEGANASLALWSWYADGLVKGQPEYFDAFWTRPGHAGCDGQVESAVVDIRAAVARTLTPADLATAQLEGFAAIFLGADTTKRVAIAVEGHSLDNAILGSRIRILTGKAAGRELYCMAVAGDAIMGSAIGEAQTLLFDGVEPGDEVRIENRDFLAFCYYSRHHVDAPDEARRLFIGGNPIYPLHPSQPLAGGTAPIFGGVELTGAVKRPLIFMNMAYDTSAWASGAALNDRAMREKLGDEAASRYRCWWLDQTEHVPASAMRPGRPPVASARLNDYGGAVEYALDAMVAWTERGAAPPPSTRYVFDADDNAVRLPTTAQERKGVQPVATLRADGGLRAEVRAGEAVSFDIEAEAPEGAGVIVELALDFDGRGSWPEVRPQTRRERRVRDEARHVYAAPGVYFPAVRVLTHAAGDPADRFARVQNLGRCRVVVR